MTRSTLRNYTNRVLILWLCFLVLFTNCSADNNSIAMTENIYDTDIALSKRGISSPKPKTYVTHTTVKTITSFSTSTTTKVAEATDLSEVPEIKCTTKEQTITSLSSHRTIHRVVVYTTYYKTMPTSSTLTSTITNVNVQTTTETSVSTNTITYTDNSIFVFTVTTPYTRTKYSRSRWTSTSRTSSTIYFTKTTSYVVGHQTINSALASTEIQYDTHVIKNNEDRGSEVYTTTVPTNTIIKPYTTVKVVLEVSTSTVISWPQIVESWSITRVTHSSAYYVTGEEEYEDAYYTLVTLNSLSEYTDTKTKIHTFTSYGTSYIVMTGANVATHVSSRTIKTTETITRTIEHVTKIPEEFTSWVPHTEIKSLTSIEEIPISTLVTTTEYIVEEILISSDARSSKSKPSSIVTKTSLSRGPSSWLSSFDNEEKTDVGGNKSTTLDVITSLSNTIYISSNFSTTSKTEEGSSNVSNNTSAKSQSASSVKSIFTTISASLSNSESNNISLSTPSTNNGYVSSEHSYKESDARSSAKNSTNISTSSSFSKNISAGSGVTLNTITRSVYLTSDSYSNRSSLSVTTYDTNIPSSLTIIKSTNSSSMSEFNNGGNTSVVSLSSNDIENLISTQNSTISSHSITTSTSGTSSKILSMSILETSVSKQSNVTSFSKSLSTSRLSWSIIITPMSSLDALNRTKSSIHSNVVPSINSDRNTSFDNTHSEAATISQYATITTHTITQPVPTSSLEEQSSLSTQRNISTYIDASELSSYLSFTSHITVSPTPGDNPSKNESHSFESSNLLISISSNSLPKTSMLSSTTNSESTNKGNHFYSSYATPISSSKQSLIQNATSRLVSYTTQVSKSQFNSKQNITSSYGFTTTSLVSEEIDAEIKTDEEEKPFSVDPSSTVYTDNATSYYSSQFNIYSNASTFESTYRISSLQNATSITLLGSITSSVLVTADSTLSFLDSTIKVSTETTLTFATVVASSQRSDTNSIIYETKPHSSDSKNGSSTYSKTKSILWESSYSTVGGVDTTISNATNSPNNIKSSSSIIYTSHAVSSSRNLNSVSLLPEETTRSVQQHTSSRSTSDSASSNDYSLQIPSLKSSEERNSKSHVLIEPTYGKTATSTPEPYISGSSSMKPSKSVPEKVMSGSSINAVESASASPTLINTKIVIQNTNTATKHNPSSALYTSLKKDKLESGVPQKMESINDNGRTLLKSKTATSSLEDLLGTSPVNVNSYSEETGIVDLKTGVTKSKRTNPTSNQYSIRSRHKTEKDSNVMELSEAIKSKEMNSERIDSISLHQNTELSSTQKLLEMKTAADIVSGSVVAPLSSSTIIIIPMSSLETPKKSSSSRAKSNRAYKTVDSEFLKPVTTEGLQYFNIAVKTDIPGMIKLLLLLFTFFMLL